MPDLGAIVRERMEQCLAQAKKGRQKLAAKVQQGEG
jgi:hypothetical protein